jgi:acyl carrier protein
VLFGDATCPHCGQLLWFLRISSGVRLYAYSQADEVRDRVIKKLADQLGVDESKVTGDLSYLKEELGADSLDTVELVMELEEEFDSLE